MESVTLESSKLIFLEEPFNPMEYHHNLTRFKIFFIKTEIPQIKKNFAAMSGFRELLKKLHPQDGRKALILSLNS